MVNQARGSCPISALAEGGRVMGKPFGRKQCRFEIFLGPFIVEEKKSKEPPTPVYRGKFAGGLVAGEHPLSGNGDEGPLSSKSTRGFQSKKLSPPGISHLLRPSRGRLFSFNKGATPRHVKTAMPFKTPLGWPRCPFPPFPYSFASR